MTKTTLPQPSPHCCNLILALLASCSAPMTLAQIRVQLRDANQCRPPETRASLLSLEEEGKVDSEQLFSRTPVFFLPHRPPRGAVLTQAAAVPKINIAPRTWFSSLGVAA